MKPDPPIRAPRRRLLRRFGIHLGVALVLCLATGFCIWNLVEDYLAKMREARIARQLIESAHGHLADDGQCRLSPTEIRSITGEPVEMNLDPETGVGSVAVSGHSYSVELTRWGTPTIEMPHRNGIPWMLFAWVFGLATIGFALSALYAFVGWLVVARRDPPLAFASPRAPV